MLTATPSPSAPRRGHLTRLGGASAPRRRLFCVPFAGGGPAAYRLWANDLPSDIEVVAVQLPGRNPAAPAPPPDSVAEIVAILRPELEAVADVPFALFGHSLGALIAFELAVALERAPTTGPDRLFVSGRASPTKLFRGRSLHALGDDAFLDALSEQFGGVPEAVRAEPDLLALLLPALRADIRTFETYAPLTDRDVRCPVHVYGGADDPSPRPDDLAGWQEVAEQPITVRVFPGGHFYLNTARAELTADLARRWTGAPVQVVAS
jgi:surfactin synthase thioesterase subunit